MCTLRGHLQDVIGLAWSPCSQYLASCSTDNTAIVFDVKKGEDISFLFSKLYYSKISDTKKYFINFIIWISMSSGNKVKKIKKVQQGNLKCFYYWQRIFYSKIAK